MASKCFNDCEKPVVATMGGTPLCVDCYAHYSKEDKQQYCAQCDLYHTPPTWPAEHPTHYDRGVIVRARRKAPR